MTNETKTTKTQAPEIGGRKGVALIMVMTVIVILTVLSVEFQYETRVYVQSTANFRDRQRALYLARSAVEFSRLIFYLQNTVDKMIKRYFRTNAPNIQLWQLLPIDSDLAKAVAGGMFSQQDQQSLLSQNTPGQSNDLEENQENAEERQENIQTMEFQQMTGFGDFEGHFHAEIVDEERKININVRPGNIREANLLKAELENLFSPVKYNPLFENPDQYGIYHDRQEIIHAILDWLDPDQERSGFQAGDEASRYEHLEEDMYASKNHLFDSLEELQLVAGVDDRFWRLFNESFTIYRTGKININTCNPEVMRALLEQYLLKPIPGEEEMQRILDVIFEFRQTNSGFWNEDAFINFITGGPELFLELEGEAKGRQELKKMITVSSGTFTVEASGDINGVLRKIKVVLQKDGTLLYYREE